MEYLKQIDIFKNIYFDNQKINLQKKRRSYKFFKLLVKSKKISINQIRDNQKILELNKIL